MVLSLSTLVLTWKLGLFADTGIASEQEWGINLKDEKTSESGVNEQGGSWYRESGEDLGENGYRCRWTVMGGRNADGSSEWKEAVGDKYFHHVFGVDKGGHFTSVVFESTWLHGLRDWACNSTWTCIVMDLMELISCFHTLWWWVAVVGEKWLDWLQGAW